MRVRLEATQLLRTTLAAEISGASSGGSGDCRLRVQSAIHFTRSGYGVAAMSAQIKRLRGHLARAAHCRFERKQTARWSSRSVRTWPHPTAIERTLPATTGLWVHAPTFVVTDKW